MIAFEPCESNEQEFQSMIIIENPSSQSRFVPNAQTCMFLIFCIGVVATFALIVGAIVAAAYVLNLAVATLVTLASAIDTLYLHADPAIQLLMIVLAGYCLVKLVRFLTRR
jgi:hypothetical protein